MKNPNSLILRFRASLAAGLLLPVGVALTGCANFQSNLNSGIATLTTDVNKGAVATGAIANDVVTIGTTAVTIATDTVKVMGVIATNTAPKVTPPPTGNVTTATNTTASP